MFKSLKKNMLNGGKGSRRRRKAKAKAKAKRKSDAKNWETIGKLAEIGLKRLQDGHDASTFLKPKITGKNVMNKDDAPEKINITKEYARNVLDGKVKNNKNKTELKKVNKWLKQEGLTKSSLSNNRSNHQGNYVGFSQYMSNIFSSPPPQIAKGGGRRKRTKRR